MTNTNDNVTRVFHAFEENPAAMNDLLKGDEKEVIRSVLNDESLSDEDLQEVVREVNDNNVMKLYLCADGQIDGAQLLEQTGGFTSVERGKKTDAIGALLDGKLDIKDLLALITLMSGNQSSQSSSGSGKAHTHNWAERTETVSHEETGHYETIQVGTKTVVDEEAWT